MPRCAPAPTHSSPSRTTRMSSSRSWGGCSRREHPSRPDAGAPSTLRGVTRSSAAPKPIGPYGSLALAIEEWDPATVDVARRVAELVHERRPDVIVEHIGSSAVRGLPGKNVVDLGFDVEAADVPAVTALLEALGFERTTGPRAFPATRPLLIGAMDHDGRSHRIHAHVHPRGNR